MEVTEVDEWPMRKVGRRKGSGRWQRILESLNGKPVMVVPDNLLNAQTAVLHAAKELGIAIDTRIADGALYIRRKTGS